MNVPVEFVVDPTDYLRQASRSNRLNFRGEVDHYSYSTLESDSDLVRSWIIYDQSWLCVECRSYLASGELTRLDGAFSVGKEQWVAIVEAADLAKATRGLSKSGNQYCALPIAGNKKAILTTRHLLSAADRCQMVASPERGPVLDDLMTLRVDGAKLSSSRGFLPPQRETWGKSSWESIGRLNLPVKEFFVLLDELGIHWTQTGRMVNFGYLPWYDPRFEALRERANWKPPRKGWMPPSLSVAARYDVEEGKLWKA